VRTSNASKKIASVVIMVKTAGKYLDVWVIDDNVLKDAELTGR
jgi:hypothetical protein